MKSKIKKYYNETLAEGIEREVKITARYLSKTLKNMGVYKSDSEIWHIAEEDTKRRVQKCVPK